MARATTASHPQGTQFPQRASFGGDAETANAAGSPAACNRRHGAIFSCRSTRFARSANRTGGARTTAGTLLSRSTVRRSFAAESGTSLAETLIAVSILAGGLLALGELFIVSGAVLRRANDLSTAAILAADTLETLRAVATGAADATGVGVDFVDAAGRVLPIDSSVAAAFTRQWSIRPLPADPDVRIVHVRVMPGRQDSVTADAAPRLAGDVTIVTAYARDEP